MSIPASTSSCATIISVPIPPTNINYISSAPGKLIVSGEHSVVYNKCAMPSVINKYTEILFNNNNSNSGNNSNNNSNNNDEDIIDIKFITTDKEKKEIILLFNKNSIIDIYHKYNIMSTINYIISPLTLTSTIDSLIYHIKAIVPPSDSFITQTSIIFLFYYIVFGLHKFNIFKLYISTQLPISSGLGSSASLMVALSYGCMYLYKSKLGLSEIEYLNLINEWAFEGEKIIHGKPSGVDNTVILYGGALLFCRGITPMTIKIHPLRFYIVNTNISRDAKKYISIVNSNITQYPHIYNPILDSIGNISLELAHILSTSPDRFNEFINLNFPQCSSYFANLTPSFNYESISKLINSNHFLLNSLGVGHTSLDKIHHIATKFNCPAKLTGAGGGGCALILIPPEMSDESLLLLKISLTEDNFHVLDVTLGGEGAKIINL